MSKKVFDLSRKTAGFFVIGIVLFSFFALPAAAQSDQFEGLRSDVGIHGLTANIHQFGNFTYKGTDTLQTDGSSELEFVYRNVRMMSPRVGVGYQVLTSFFVDGPNSSFGVGSWGAGPVLRGYPFKTDRFQPYAQLNSLIGNNLGLGRLANTDQADGIRIRLGVRAGAAFHITNKLGIFGEVGYDWESSTLFKAEARKLQVNLGVDLYLFN